MAQDVEVINIDTGNSVQTIKSLKEEIKNLRNELENCEVGSEQFHSTLNQLTNAQNQLKNATKTTSSENEALAGSYNALTTELNKLKKEWKATADEAERADIGGQISEINQKLKDMDAEIGNYQRNVGNYGSAFDDLSIKVGDNGATFERLNKTSQDVIGSFDVLEGGLKAVGIESSLVTGLMDKLEGAMKMTQGFKSIKEGKESFQMLKLATNGATAATTGFKKAIIATGIGALVVAVGLLIANWDKVSKLWNNTTPQEKAAKANRELNKELSKLSAQSASDKVTRIKELSRAYQNLGDNLNDKKKFVKDYAGELEDMGIEMNDVNDAEKIFRDKTQDYINAVMARAKADALREKAAKDYASYLETRAILEQDLADAKSKKASGTPDKTFGQKVGEVLIGSAFSQGASVADTQKLNKDWTDEIAQDAVDAAQKKLDDAETEINAKMDKLFKEADKEDEKANEYLKKTPTGGNSGGGSGGGSGSGSVSKEKTQAEIDAENLAKKLEEIQKRAAEYIEQNRLSLLDTKEKEIAELTSKYEEEKKLFEGKQEELTRLKEEYDIKSSEITKKYQEKEREELLKTIDTHLSAIETAASYNEQITNTKFDEKSLALDENDAVGAIQLEIDKTLELQAIREQAFNEQMAQIQALLDAELQNNILTAEQEAELQAQYNAIQQQKIESTADANNQIATLNKQLVKQQQSDNRQLAQNITTTFTSALNAASNILSAVQEGIDTTNKEGFEKNKKLQIANATIGMLVGITNAIAGLFTTKSGPWDIALAAIQAGAIATTGAIQIANIKKTRQDGGGGSNENFNMPSINTSALLSTPINYTSEVQGAQAIEDIPDTRVYVVESDITDTVKKVQVAEEESTY